MDNFSNSDRTWMCSILFLDIVNYSSQSLQLQMEWKGRFNHFVHETIDGLPEGDRFILDTGDGAVVCFMGSPHAAMEPALEMRKHFVETEPMLPSPMRIRMGINLGPVQLVKDINDRLNAVGDGINVGQRVMSFAADNQILVSRSFYEVVSRLSDSYGPMFSFVGDRKDKHGRAHLLYQLAPASQGATIASAIDESLASPTPLAQFDGAALDYLQTLLVPVLGPIARHVIQDVSQKHTNLADLCSELATQFAGNKERARFLEQCRQQFGLPVLPSSGVAAKAPPPAESASGIVWDPAMLEKTTKELAVYIGPMAKFIVDSTASKVHSVKDFYDALCREIPSRPDRERFLSRCKAGT